MKQKKEIAGMQRLDATKLHIMASLLNFKLLQMNADPQYLSSS